MGFHEVQFPTDIALGATGGPERRTEIVVLGSGHERRNAAWAGARRRYNIGYGVKGLDDLFAVLGFFEARQGRLYGFRFKDFTDFRSGAPTATPSPSDQVIGTGDGATLAFALTKSYGEAQHAIIRPITKPVAGTVRVVVAGVERTAGTDFTVNAATGVVTFTSPPALGAAITAGFSFDVPVRFDIDRLEINLSQFRAGSIPSIPIIEVRA